MAEPNGPMRPPNGGSRPVPDPTDLTTEQLEKGLASERAYADGQLEVLRERLTGIDRATELLRTDTIKIPNRIDEKIAHLSAVMNEKFNSIAIQFLERDTRSERESRDNTKAVDAAFAAQKEQAARQDESNQKAIDKSEAAMAEKIDKLAELFKSTTDALSDKIDDVKGRQDRSEASKQGGQEARVVARETRAGLSTTASLGIAAAGLLLLLVSTVVTVVALTGGP